jgi:hypothetical protein
MNNQRILHSLPTWVRRYTGKDFIDSLQDRADLVEAILGQHGDCIVYGCAYSADTREVSAGIVVQNEEFWLFNGGTATVGDDGTASLPVAGSELTLNATYAESNLPTAAKQEAAGYSIKQLRAVDIGATDLLALPRLEDLLTAALQAQVSALDTEVGTLTEQVTSNTQAIEALRSSMVILGRVPYTNAEVTADPSLLPQWLQDNNPSYYPPQNGYTLIDSDNHDWVYNGAEWVDVDYSGVGTATNSSLGVVMGSEENLKASVGVDGTLTVNGLPAIRDAATAAVQAATVGSASVPKQGTTLKLPDMYTKAEAESSNSNSIDARKLQGYDASSVAIYRGELPTAAADDFAFWVGVANGFYTAAPNTVPNQPSAYGMVSVVHQAADVAITWVRLGTSVVNEWHRTLTTSADSGWQQLAVTQAGQWTPVLDGYAASEYTVQYAQYTRVGSLVHCNVSITNIVQKLSDVPIIIVNLPFSGAAINSLVQAMVAPVYSASDIKYPFGIVGSGSKALALYYAYGSANAITGNAVLLQNHMSSSTIELNFSYITND